MKGDGADAALIRFSPPLVLLKVRGLSAQAIWCLVRSTGRWLRHHGLWCPGWVESLAIAKAVYSVAVPGLSPLPVQFMVHAWALYQASVDNAFAFAVTGLQPT